MAANNEGNLDTCGICLNKFNQPKLMPCYHTFCCECLTTTVCKSPDIDRFNCPTCRYEVMLPEGGVRKLKTDFYIEARAHKDAQKEECECDECWTGECSYLCHECDFILCDSCMSTHITHPTSSGTRSHSIIRLGNQTESDGDSPFVSRDTFCEKHDKEKLRYHCKQCNKIICGLCLQPDHKGHAYEYICDAVSSSRANLAETKLKLEKYLPEIAMDKVSVNREINQTINELVDRIGVVRKAGIEKLRNGITDITEVTRPRRLFLHRQVNHIANMLRDGLDFDIVALDGEMKRRLKEVENMDHSATCSQNPRLLVTSSLHRLDRLGCDVSDVITGLVSQICRFQEELTVLSQFSCGNDKIRSIDLLSPNDAFIVSANHGDPGDDMEYFLNGCTSHHVKLRVKIPPQSFNNDDVITINEAIEANDSEWNYKIEKFPERSSSSDAGDTRDPASPSVDQYKAIERDLNIFKRKYLYCGFTRTRDKCWVDRDNDWVIIKPTDGVARILDFNPFAKPGTTFMPLDVCWGKSSLIYIVDRGSQAIIVYSAKEGFQKTIIIPGKSFVPSAVAMDKNGKLWIGQMNGTVSVCSLV